MLSLHLYDTSIITGQTERSSSNHRGWASKLFEVMFQHEKTSCWWSGCVVELPMRFKHVFIPSEMQSIHIQHFLELRASCHYVVDRGWPRFVLSRAYSKMLSWLMIAVSISNHENEIGTRSRWNGTRSYSFIDFLVNQLLVNKTSSDANIQSSSGALELLDKNGSIHLDLTLNRFWLNSAPFKGVCSWKFRRTNSFIRRNINERSLKKAFLRSVFDEIWPSLASGCWCNSYY